MRALALIGLLLSACSDDPTNPNNNNGNDLAGQQGLPDLSTINNQTDGSMNNKGDMAMVPCTCPKGYSCDANGQCTGGDPNSLQLDVATIKLSGTVTVNGAVPAIIAAACTPTSTEATVHLDDSARGHSFDIPVLCSATSAAFDAVIFPGDYDVTVTGDETKSDIPMAAYKLPKLSITADKSNYALDLKMVQVDGTVTLNGAIPTNVQCPGDVTVELIPTSDSAGNFVELTAPCASPVAFSGKIYPGSYNVVIAGVGDANTNAQQFFVSTVLDASASKHGLAFDVKTFNVGGPITIDGSAPNMTDCTNLAGTTVIFVDNKTGAYAQRSATCTTNVLSVASFKLFAGEYSVSLFGDGAPLQNQEYPITDKLAITANTTNQTFNVSTASAAIFNVGGTVTLNGVAPVASNNCFSSKGVVTFVDAKMNDTSFSIACGAGNTFTGMLPAGTYDVFVSDGNDGSDLLTPPFPAAKGVVINANKTNFAFDEKTVTVSGKVTLNGQDPATVGTCNGIGQSEGSIQLTQKDGPSFSLPIPCSTGIFAWTGLVYPGTYTVSVNGNGTSSLPDEPYKLATPIDTASAGSIKIDVLTTNVAGKILLNGMQPMTTTACNANPTQHKATVTLFNIDQSTSFSLPVLCSSQDFSWNGVVFPGTYRITVSGAGGFSSLPKNTFLAVPKLKI